MKILRGQTILFQGDSITDCGRERSEELNKGLNAQALGVGYPYLVASAFSARYPELGATFYNRGISGNRVKDLQARWDADCIDLKPDWVSILIGINDTWRRYDSNDPTGAEDYEKGYRDILTRTRAAYPNAGLIILEPFVLPTPADRLTWREDLDPKIAAARLLAREFGAYYLPLDGIFAAASSRVEASFWAYDGVHPSPAGHALIAEHWLKLIEE